MFGVQVYFLDRTGVLLFARAGNVREPPDDAVDAQSLIKQSRLSQNSITFIASVSVLLAKHTLSAWSTTTPPDFKYGGYKAELPVYDEPGKLWLLAYCQGMSTI